MTQRAIRLADVGEGVTEAELVEWHVAPGDLVRSDDALATVMTDKAAIEIPSAHSGRVLSLGAAAGDMLAVGGVLVEIDTMDEDADADSTPAPPEAHPDDPAPARPAEPGTKDGPATAPPPKRATGARPQASPAVRAHARKLGIGLADVTATGPRGRILREDVDAFAAGRATAEGDPGGEDGIEEIRVIGLRRRIAENMARSHARVAPITLIEEVDVSPLEDLRARLNAQTPRGPHLTLLPFVLRALVAALAEHREMNARFDDEAGILRRYRAVHAGIATQTENGLVVPVLHHAERRSLGDLAAGIARLAAAARDGSITRQQLTGGTITLTSLGPLGAIATTPIVNAPEVAIVGVNRIATRPVWDGEVFRPRRMMNISASFDHRVIDGWNAATFVKTLKTRLEDPEPLAARG